ncbi:hypothetical protein [Aureimonas jatrophae]|uniref:hypothetical protein n=1 Tax=Aureimonas jatrophae TaxID=1166073 RepID=UPI00147C7E3D|nr:hypothetical protein [Aureimonas jatrophae]MBB3949987.1 hypothetical protein [Aureimonas jatrophae]
MNLVTAHLDRMLELSDPASADPAEMTRQDAAFVRSGAATADRRNAPRRSITRRRTQQ